MTIRRSYENGVLIEEWNTDVVPAIYTDFRTEPDTVQVLSADLVLVLNAIDSAALNESNKAQLLSGMTQAISDALARQAAYQLVIDTSNPTINASPASYIKDVAQQGKRSERALIRLLRVVGNLTASTDTGTN